MKKTLLAGFLGLAISATMLCVPALAEVSQGQFSEKREEIRQLREDRKEGAAALKGLVAEAREDAGIIPLSDEEKAVLKAAKEEVLPLIETLKALKAEYQSIKDSGDSERIEEIKSEVNRIRAQIQSVWDSVSAQRAKLKENREKANSTYRTESFVSGQKQRHELWNEAKGIHQNVKDLLAQIKEAKAANDESKVAALSEQVSAALDSLSVNINQRILVIDELINGMIE